ncbi:MAG: hypothetical protein AB3N16_11730, partial [Flavobacteriaceae bacterium]
MIKNISPSDLPKASRELDDPRFYFLQINPRSWGIYLLLLASFFLGNTANAQITNNRYKVTLASDNLKTCGGANNSNSTVTILSYSDTSNSFSITFNLPDGVEYVANTVAILNQPAKGNYTVMESGTPQNPVFSIERPSNANWELGHEVVVTFERSANCDAVAHLDDGGIFKDLFSIDFEDAYGQKSFDADSNLVNSYALLAASLSISDINTLLANVGNTYTRDIVVAQGGEGCTTSFEHTVNVGANLNDYQLSFAGNVLTPSTQSGSLYTYIIDLAAEPFLSNSGLGTCFDN